MFTTTSGPGRSPGYHTWRSARSVLRRAKCNGGALGYHANSKAPCHLRSTRSKRVGMQISKVGVHWVL